MTWVRAIIESDISCVVANIESLESRYGDLHRPNYCEVDTVVRGRATPHPQFQTIIFTLI